MESLIDVLSGFLLVCLILVLAVVIWLIVTFAPALFAMLWTHVVLLFTGRLKELGPIYKETGAIFKRQYDKFKSGR